MPAPRSPVSWRTVPLWTTATVLFVLSVAFDWPAFLRGPAPYPPEWQWLRRDEATSGRVLPVLLTAAVLVALLAATSRRWDRPRRAAGFLLAGGTAAGLLFATALLGLEPAGAFDTVFGRVVYRTATSYYTVAVSPDAADPLAFLRRHHELLSGFRKAAKHAATHPPGPVLYYRGILAACERAPRFARGVLDLAGIPDVSPRHPRPQHAPAARATALLGGLGMLLAAALAAWPVAALARAVGLGPLAAARVGLLWLIVPGPVLMAPQIDQMIALPVAASCAALALAVVEREEGRALAWAAVAGAGGGAAVFLTYGAPAFLAVGGLAALGLGLVRGIGARVIATRVGLAAATTAALFLAPALLGHHPIASLFAALAIHREFYTAPRQYGAWLVFDPLDVAVFLGAPVAAALVVALVRARREAAGRLGAGGFRLGAALGLALLVVSGQTRGEVGRLWIPIMPVLLVAALARPARTEEADAGDGPTAVEACVLAVLLAACCLVLRGCWKLA